ncbi:THO complex subunit 4C-like isoform X2 [Brassica napus]|uniref:THO complex subunit 4C-like isoform X2 n=1 Tax=Brassica napus TaxID=3708 RepID=UPI0020790D72|nr:THO complex subunit 4C-like isoform X2 [Brassica napus]
MKLVINCFLSPHFILRWFLTGIGLSDKRLNRRKKNLPWQNGLFEESMRSVGVTGIEVGTTVYVTNLDQGVTNEDIRELFGEIGEMKRYAIHYDQNGRPNGSAEVVYMRRSDAFQAMKRYNNVLLDGRSMKLEILGGNNEVAPVAARVNVTGLNGRMKRTVSIGQGIRGGRGRGRSAAPSMRSLPIGNQQGGGVRSGRGGFRGRGRGQAGGGRGNKGGRGGKKAVEKSAEELDKDLETYHAEAMNIS